MIEIAYFDGLYEIRAFPNQPRFTVLLENAPDVEVCLSDRSGYKVNFDVDQLYKCKPQFVRKYDGPEPWMTDGSGRKEALVEEIDPQDWKYTTLKSFPYKRVGITLVDEKHGYTGIYIRDENGGLWPARTVSHKPKKHHASVLNTWMSQYEDCQDKRSVASICKTAVKE